MRNQVMCCVIFSFLSLVIFANQSAALDGRSGLKLQASNLVEGNRFGVSVAISGDRAVIIAVGAAFIFRRDKSGWSEEAKLDLGDRKPSRGHLVVSIDGNFCVIGVPEDDHAGKNSGAAFVFERDGVSWNQVATLVPKDAKAGSMFGSAVSVNNNRCVIGAVDDNTNGPHSGKAYVFQSDGKLWSQVSKLSPADAHPYAWFGNTVSIDGDYCVISSRGPNKLSQDFKPILAYVFHKTGDNWIEQAQLQPNIMRAWTVHYPVDINDDHVVIGACLTKKGSTVYVFKRDGEKWEQEVKLNGHKTHGSSFGLLSVALSGDFLIVGAPIFVAPMSAAYVYRYSNGDWQRWSILKIDDEPNDGMFASAVATDGEYILIGSPNDPKTGAAYIWTTSWRDIPNPLTEKQINEMTIEEIKNALEWIATARVRFDIDAELDKRLLQEFRLLIEHSRQLRDQDSKGN